MDKLVLILSTACSITSFYKHVLYMPGTKLLFCGVDVLVRKPDNKQMSK